jgi:hypothetical protein
LYLGRLDASLTDSWLLTNLNDRHRFHTHFFQVPLTNKAHDGYLIKLQWLLDKRTSERLATIIDAPVLQQNKKSPLTL